MSSFSRNSWSKRRAGTICVASVNWMSNVALKPPPAQLLWHSLSSPTYQTTKPINMSRRLAPSDPAIIPLFDDSLSAFVLMSLCVPLLESNLAQCNYLPTIDFFLLPLSLLLYRSLRIVDFQYLTCSSSYRLISISHFRLYLLPFPEASSYPKKVLCCFLSKSFILVESAFALLLSSDALIPIKDDSRKG